MLDKLVHNDTTETNQTQNKILKLFVLITIKFQQFKRRVKQNSKIAYLL